MSFPNDGRNQFTFTQQGNVPANRAPIVGTAMYYPPRVLGSNNPQSFANHQGPYQGAPVGNANGMGPGNVAGSTNPLMGLQAGVPTGYVASVTAG